MLQPGRSVNVGGYRYGFNGQEKSDEVAKGSTTALFWEYDSRIGRRWNIDSKPITGISEYAVFNNNPIWFSDPLGDSSIVPLMPRHPVNSVSEVGYVPYNIIGAVVNGGQSLLHKAGDYISATSQADPIAGVNNQISKDFNSVSDFIKSENNYYRTAPWSQIKQDAITFFTTVDNYFKAFENAVVIVSPFKSIDISKSFTLKSSGAVNGLYRRGGNIGPFTSLEVPLQMRTVKKVANQAGIGLNGITLKIVRDPELIGRNLFGQAIKNRIHLYPDAFSSYENLVKTLGHERTHLFQFKTYGFPNELSPEMINMFEKSAMEIEETFYQYYKKNK
jgi:hypothetical protein